jgi:hypothetical protein
VFHAASQQSIIQKQVDVDKMKISFWILSALTGWISGIVSLFGWSFLWPKIIPMTDRASALPGYWKVLLFIMVLITPIALIGGIVGGRLPREGGKREQFLYAMVFGALLTLVFGSCGFWYSGW